MREQGLQYLNDGFAEMVRDLFYFVCSPGMFPENTSVASHVLHAKYFGYDVPILSFFNIVSLEQVTNTLGPTVH